MASITTTGAHSFNLSIGTTNYRLGWGTWTEVPDPDHMRWLLAPTPNGAILREDKDLSPYFVRSTENTIQPEVTFDRKKNKYQLSPDKWTPVDRVAAQYLLRSDDVICMTAHEMLQFNPEAPILIKRDEGLGDLMFLTAAVRALRREHPTADLTLATKTRYVDLMFDTGLFDRVVDFVGCYDLAPFALTADMTNYVEAHPDQHTKIRTEIFANGLGVSCNGDYRGVFNHNYELPKDLIPQGDNVVAVDISGSVWMRRPTDYHAAKIVQAVADAGFIPVGLHWHPCGWWPEGVGLNLNGCSWEEYVTILDNTIILAVDTGTLHVANALKRPAVGLFGPFRSHLRVQGLEECITIDSDRHCIGCVETKAPCPGNKAICFNDIPIEKIVDGLREVQKWQ